MLIKRAINFIQKPRTRKVFLGISLLFVMVLGGLAWFLSFPNNLTDAKASGYNPPTSVYQDAYTYENGFKDSGAGITTITGFNHDSLGFYQAASLNANLESECLTLPLPSGAIFNGWQFLDFEMANRENGGLGSAQYDIKVTSCDLATTYSQLTDAQINADVKSLDIRPAGTNPIKITFTTTNNTVANGVKIDYWKVVGKTTGATNVTVTPDTTLADLTTGNNTVPFTINFNSNGAIAHDAKLDIPMEDVNGFATPSVDDGLSEDAEVDYGDGNGLKPRVGILIQSASNTNTGVVPSPNAFFNPTADDPVWDVGNLADGSAGSTQVSLLVPGQYFNGRKFALRGNLSFGYIPRENLGFDTTQKISTTSPQITVKSILTGNLYPETRFIPNGANPFGGYATIPTNAINVRADNYIFGYPNENSDREDLTFTITFNTGSCIPIYEGVDFRSDYGPLPPYDYTIVSAPTVGTSFNSPLVISSRRHTLGYNSIAPKFDVSGSGCVEGQEIIQNFSVVSNSPFVASTSSSSVLTIQNNFTRSFVNYFSRLMYDGIVSNNYSPIAIQSNPSPANLVKPGEYIGYSINGSGQLASQTSVIDHTYSTMTIPNGLSFNGVKDKDHLDYLYKDCSGSALQPDNGGFDSLDPTNSGWKNVNINWSGSPFSIAPDANNPGSVIPGGCKLLIRKDLDSPFSFGPDFGAFEMNSVFQVCDGTFCAQQANDVIMKINDGKVFTKIGASVYGPSSFGIGSYSDEVKIANGSYPSIQVVPVAINVQGGSQASILVFPGNVGLADEKVDARWVVNFFSIRDKVDLNTVSASIQNPTFIPPGGNTSNIIFHPPNSTQCLAALNSDDVACMAWWEVPLNTEPPTAWGTMPWDFRDATTNNLYYFILNVNLKTGIQAGTSVSFLGEVRNYNSGTGLPTTLNPNTFSGNGTNAPPGNGGTITVLDIPGVNVTSSAPSIWPNNNTTLKYSLGIKNTGTSPNNGLYIVNKLPKNGVDNTTYEPQYRKITTNYNSAQVIVEYSDTPTCYTNVSGATWTAMPTTDNNIEFINGALTDNDVPQTAFCTRIRLNTPAVTSSINPGSSLQATFNVLVENTALSGSNVYNLVEGGATPNAFGQSGVSLVSATPVRTIIDNKVQINGVKTVEIDPTRAGLVKWKLKYQNTSGLATTGITNIVDTLPAGLTFDSVELPNPNPNGVSCVPVNCLPVGNTLTFQINSIDAYDGFANGLDEGEISVWMKIPDLAPDGTSYQNCFDITTAQPNTQVQSGICATLSKATNFTSIKSQTFLPNRGVNGNSNQIVRPSDIITYNITSTNTEGGPRFYRVYDQLDTGLNYIPGTLQINSISQSDSLFTVVSGRDTLNYEYPIAVNSAASVTVQFQAIVKSGLTNDQLILNNATISRCSVFSDISTCIPAEDSNSVQSQFQTPTTIIGSDITSSSCTPNSGVVGYSTTCTANFSNYKTGTISFSSGTGNCTTPLIQTADTTASCTFITTTPGVSAFAVTANASGGGTAASGNLTVNYLPITSANLTSANCTPNTGLIGYSTTCTANFIGNFSGAISFLSGTGNCTTPGIQTGDTLATCNFITSTASSNPFAVTANASGGGNISAGSLSVFNPVTDLELATIISCVPKITTINQTVICTGTLPAGKTVTGLQVKVDDQGLANCSVNGQNITCNPANVGPNKGNYKVTSFTTGISPLNGSEVDNIEVQDVLNGLIRTGGDLLFRYGFYGISLVLVLSLLISSLKKGEFETANIPSKPRKAKKKIKVVDLEKIHNHSRKEEELLEKDYQ